MRRFTSCCIFLVFVTGLSPFAFSQLGLSRQEYSGDGSLIQMPREVESLLIKAKGYIKTEAWSEATLAIGILLGLEKQDNGNELHKQDYFTQTDPAPTIRGSLRDTTIEILNDIPEAGIKVFELRYGVAAKQILDAAVATGDWGGIESVSRSYPGTAAGREATWLCAEGKIGRGLPMDAAVILDRMMTQSLARNQFGVGGFVLSAACWKAAGQMDAAQSILKTAKVHFPKAPFNWRGKRHLMSAETDSLIDSIELGDYAPSRRKETQPLWVGGDLERNADTPAGVPLPLVNWKFPMHESDQHEIAATKTIKQKANDRSVTLIPSRVPIIVPPWAIMLTYDQRINAINLKTGKVDWTGSFTRIPYDLSLDRVPGRETGQSDLPVPDYLARRIWGDAASGQLSSDSHNVYSLTEMPSIDATESLTLGNANIFRPLGKRPYNVLQAWSVETQGKLIWEVGGETGLSEPRLAGALFLGSPVAYDSELLILGELNGEVYLFSMAPNSGQLLWSQQLVANQGISLADSPRRTMGCSPSIAAGCVLCPTLSGHLVAIDLNSRSLLWAHRYPMDQEVLGNMRFNGLIANDPFGDSLPHKLRSADAAVLIIDNCVVHAPIDGDAVYAIDLFNGDRLWEVPKNNGLFVAASWNGRVLIVSDQAVSCLDSHTGKSRWEKPLTLSSMGRVAGRGVRNGQRYFLPMSNQEILEIDFETGTIVDKMRVKEPLGNLVATADQLISLSPVDLTAYTIRDRLKAEIDIEFAQGVSSSAALQRRGKILLAGGKIGEALDAIEAAYRENRQDPEVRVLLGEVAMMGLREDFAKHSSRVAEYEELIGFGSEKTTYLILLIDGLMQQGSYIKATEKLLELSDLNSDSRVYQSAMQETVEPESSQQVRQEIWVAARLAQLYEAASTMDREKIMMLVQPRLLALEKMRRSIDYYRRSDIFRWLPASGKLRFQDAISIFEERDSLLAEQTLEEAFEVAARSLTEKSKSQGAVAEVANELNELQSQTDSLRFNIYNKAGRWTTSVSLANRLNKPLSEVQNQPTVVESTRESPRRASLADLPNLEDFNRYVSGIKNWPKGKPTVEVVPFERPLQTITGGTPLAIKQRVGTALENWTVSLLQTSIEFIAPNGLQRISTTPDIRSDQIFLPMVHLIDSIAVIETQNSLIAMDTLRASEIKENPRDTSLENILWSEPVGRTSSVELPNRNPFGGQSTGSRLLAPEKPWEDQKFKNRKGFFVGPSSRAGVIVASNGLVFALDPRTGTRRWTRSGIGSVGSLPTIALADNRLAILDRANWTRWILDSRDGKLISKEDWHDTFDVWCTSGQNVLSVFEHKNDGKRISFKLWDAFTSEIRIEGEFSKDVKAEVCEQEKLIAWEPDGKLVFWNLPTGKESIYQITLPPKSGFKRIALERFGDAILVMTDGVSFQLTDLVKADESDRSHKCRGPMIALDGNDGHPLWEKPILIYDFRFPISQMRSTPAVTLTRLLKFKSNKNTVESGSVAILDIRTGQLVYSNDYLHSIRGTEFQFQSCAKLGKAELDFQYRGAELHVVWSQEEPGPSAAESDSLLQIGKLDRAQLEADAPKEFIERLQSDGREDPFGSDAGLDRPFDAKRDR